MDAHAQIFQAWMNQLRQGDEDAARQVWDSFFQRLIEVATRRLKYVRSSDYDEEDIVLSALKSFYLGVRNGRFPKLEDHDDLWRLLFVITSRKIADRFAFQRRAKRDTKREAVNDWGSATDSGQAWFISDEPDPALVVECEEQLARLLESLEHEDLKQVAVWKMEGHTNEEIAALMSRSLATVERKLRTIREIWSQV